VALSGTGYAAATLAANTVGTKQIINGAVHTVDLHGNAVNSAKTKDNSLTGADIAEGTLGTVPNAAKVGNQTVTKIRYIADSGTGETTVYAKAGLTLTQTCPANGSIGAPELTARSSVNDSSIYTTVINDPGTNPPGSFEDDYESRSFDNGLTMDMLVGDDGDIAFINFEYDTIGGVVITGTLVSDAIGGGCSLNGHITAG
jgi:hypothetical protein